MTDPVGEVDLIRVVLADANVLYPRVLRDYLLYAADQEIIAITWSEQILAEIIEHLERNVAAFDHVSGERLVRAMNRGAAQSRRDGDCHVDGPLARLGMNYGS